MQLLASDALVHGPWIAYDWGCHVLGKREQLPTTLAARATLPSALRTPSTWLWASYTICYGPKLMARGSWPILCGPHGVAHYLSPGIDKHRAPCAIRRMAAHCQTHVLNHNLYISSYVPRRYRSALWRQHWAPTRVWMHIYQCGITRPDGPHCTLTLFYIHIFLLWLHSELTTICSMT